MTDTALATHEDLFVLVRHDRDIYAVFRPEQAANCAQALRADLGSG